MGRSGIMAWVFWRTVSSAIPVGVSYRLTPDACLLLRDQLIFVVRGRPRRTLGRASLLSGGRGYVSELPENPGRSLPAEMLVLIKLAIGGLRKPEHSRPSSWRCVAISSSTRWPHIIHLVFWIDGSSSSCGPSSSSGRNTVQTSLVVFMTVGDAFTSWHHAVLPCRHTRIPAFHQRQCHSLHE